MTRQVLVICVNYCALTTWKKTRLPLTWEVEVHEKVQEVQHGPPDSVREVHDLVCPLFAKLVRLYQTAVNNIFK